MPFNIVFCLYRKINGTCMLKGFYNMTRSWLKLLGSRPISKLTLRDEMCLPVFDGSSSLLVVVCSFSCRRMREISLRSNFIWCGFTSEQHHSVQRWHDMCHDIAVPWLIQRRVSNDGVKYKTNCNSPIWLTYSNGVYQILCNSDQFSVAA